MVMRHIGGFSLIFSITDERGEIGVGTCRRIRRALFVNQFPDGQRYKRGGSDPTEEEGGGNYARWVIPFSQLLSPSEHNNS